MTVNPVQNKFHKHGHNLACRKWKNFWGFFYALAVDQVQKQILWGHNTLNHKNKNFECFCTPQMSVKLVHKMIFVKKINMRGQKLLMKSSKKWHDLLLGFWYLIINFWLRYLNFRRANTEAVHVLPHIINNVEVVGFRNFFLLFKNM